MATCANCGEPLRTPFWEHEAWECRSCGAYYGAAPPRDPEPPEEAAA
jgi:ribosomal protein L37AE/L43A